MPLLTHIPPEFFKYRLMFCNQLNQMKELYLFTVLAYKLGAVGYIEHMAVLRELQERVDLMDAQRMAKWVTEGIVPIKLAEDKDVRDWLKELKELKEHKN